jgi:hypothetical protein
MLATTYIVGTGAIRTQWFLLQDQKHRVKQFEVLGEVVQLVLVSNKIQCPREPHIHSTK